MVSHSFTTVERNIPTFTCNTLCIVSTILFVNKNDMKFKKNYYYYYYYYYYYLTRYTFVGLVTCSPFKNKYNENFNYVKIKNKKYTTTNELLEF